MECEFCINGRSQIVRRRRRGGVGKEKINGGNERKGKDKRKKIKEKEKEKKEKKMKEAGGVFLSSLAFRRSELVGPRSKVWRFDDGIRFKR